VKTVGKTKVLERTQKHGPDGRFIAVGVNAAPGGGEEGQYLGGVGAMLPVNQPQHDYTRRYIFVTVMVCVLGVTGYLCYLNAEAITAAVYRVYELVVVYLTAAKDWISPYSRDLTLVVVVFVVARIGGRR